MVSQGWKTLKDITANQLDEEKDLTRTNNDGSFEAHPLNQNLRIIRDSFFTFTVNVKGQTLH
jgi:hypothetical protein